MLKSAIAATERRNSTKRNLPTFFSEHMDGTGVAERDSCLRMVASTQVEGFVAHACLPFFKQYRLLYALVISPS